MSFNDTFDYTNIIERLNSRISLLSFHIANITNDLQNVNNIIGFQEIKDNHLNRLNTLKSHFEDELAQLNNCLNDITSLQNLSNENKNTLYSFYLLLNVTTEEFMKKIIHNHTSFLQDQNVINIINCSQNCNESKKIIASDLFHSIPDIYSTLCF